MDERRLEGGKLLLFTRNDVWQARIALGNRRYLWKSLKTEDERNAQREAIKLFHITGYKLEEGSPVQSRTFSSVLSEFKAYRERDHEVGKPNDCPLWQLLGEARGMQSQLFAGPPSITRRAG